MTLNEWGALYLGAGIVLAFLGWFRVHMLPLGKQIIGLLVLMFLWLPLAVALLVGLLFWRHRPGSMGQKEQPAWKTRRAMNALKDKHDIDDKAVLDCVSADLKNR